MSKKKIEIKKVIEVDDPVTYLTTTPFDDFYKFQSLGISQEYNGIYTVVPVVKPIYSTNDEDVRALDPNSNYLGAFSGYYLDSFDQSLSDMFANLSLSDDEALPVLSDTEVCVLNNTVEALENEQPIETEQPLEIKQPLKIEKPIKTEATPLETNSLFKPKELSRAQLREMRSKARKDRYASRDSELEAQSQQTNRMPNQ